MAEPPQLSFKTSEFLFSRSLASVNPPHYLGPRIQPSAPCSIQDTAVATTAAAAHAIVALACTPIYIYIHCCCHRRSPSSPGRNNKHEREGARMIGGGFLISKQ
uniref:Uncharacterized protein n=1 Tax=Sipha flava TaxID=143950 RepID=A0A2S2QD81_9HEMI